MNFDSVDPELQDWARKRNLPLSTLYQDVEVRSFQLVGATGKRAQIWVEMSGGVKIFVWDYRRRKKRIDAEVGHLSDSLDEAHRLANEWLGG